MNGSLPYNRNPELKWRVTLNIGPRNTYALNLISETHGLRPEWNCHHFESHLGFLEIFSFICIFLCCFVLSEALHFAVLPFKGGTEVFHDSSSRNYMLQPAREA